MGYDSPMKSRANSSLWKWIDTGLHNALTCKPWNIEHIFQGSSGLLVQNLPKRMHNILFYARCVRFFIASTCQKGKREARQFLLRVQGQLALRKEIDMDSSVSFNLLPSGSQTWLPATSMTILWWFSHQSLHVYGWFSSINSSPSWFGWGTRLSVSTLVMYAGANINILQLYPRVSLSTAAFLGLPLPGEYHDKMPFCLPSSCHSSPDKAIWSQYITMAKSDSSTEWWL